MIVWIIYRINSLNYQPFQRERTSWEWSCLVSNHLQSSVLVWSVSGSALWDQCWTSQATEVSAVVNQKKSAWWNNYVNANMTQNAEHWPLVLLLYLFWCHYLAFVWSEISKANPAYACMEIRKKLDSLKFNSKNQLHAFQNTFLFSPMYNVKHQN